MKITKDELDQLINNKITSLTYDARKITDDGLLKFIEILKNNTSLTYLRWRIDYCPSVSKELKHPLIFTQQIKCLSLICFSLKAHEIY